MESFLGGLAFAGIVAAHFLAVVAVSKWNASTAAMDDQSGMRATGCEERWP